MNKQVGKSLRRSRRRTGIRKRIEGTPGRPRLAIYKSLKHIYAQIIDDMAGRTICAASTVEGIEGLDKTGNAAAAILVGKAIAAKAKAAGVTQVAFDRGGFKFHGRVKALAQGARDGGLQF